MLLGFRKFQDFNNKISLELPVFSTDDCQGSEAFYEKHADTIFDMMLACLELAIESNFKSIPCFVVDGETMEIARKDYPEKIELCRKHFEKKEEYEKCSRVLQLNERMNNYHGKRKIEIS